MSFLRDLLAVYGRVGRRGLELALRHWWLGLVATGYQAALLGVALLVGPFGLAGGLVLTFAMAALMSSWFVLVGHVVREGRTTLEDVPGSFVVYLGDVLTFGFLLWILQYAAGVALAGFGYLTIVFELALLVFLSAVPEEIYLGGESGAAIFVESYRFVATNWIEWLPATAILLVVVAAASLVPVVLLKILAGGFAFGAMFIVRGLLFLELSGSSRRAREFRRQAMR